MTSIKWIRVLIRNVGWPVSRPVNVNPKLNSVKEPNKLEGCLVQKISNGNGNRIKYGIIVVVNENK